jgi:TonB family protein
VEAFVTRHPRPSWALAACLAVFSGSPGLAQDEPRVAGKDVPAPKRTKTVLPEYPAEAQARGVRGIVLLELLIDADGKVTQVEVVRSIPGLDEAAVAAARRFEYEVTKVDGKPVPVRLTVPITFAMRLPEVIRQDGIPELRSGASPAFPAGSARGPASVSVEVTLDPDGSVAEARLRSGEEPWSRSLMQALRTWRFEASPGGAMISFRVQADFLPAAKGNPERVELRLSGLRHSETAPLAESSPPPAPEPVPSPTAEPSPAAAPPAPEQPAPLPAPLPGPPSPAPQASEPARPETPPPPTPTVDPTPPPAPPVEAPPRAAPPPETEVLSAPAPRTAPSAPAIEENGISAVPDVSLQPGVPELVSGRRPVVPPLARMAGASGTVEVRFAVDAAGTPALRAVEGPELLKPAAESAVATWAFRRQSAERLLLKAVFSYGGSAASAVVSPLAEEPPK